MRSVTAVALLVLIAGCGDGETISLTSPGGATEWPHDPGWRHLNAIRHDDRFLAIDLDRDGAAGFDAVAVGRLGAVVVAVGDHWHREDPGTAVDLHDVTLAPGGRVCAVGDDGVILVRSQDRWRIGAEGGADLSRIVADDGGTLWVCGDEGTVLRGEGDDWTDVSLPTASSLLAIAAFGDSVVAGGDDGRLHFHAKGAWMESAGPWGAVPVQGLDISGRGEPVVCADSLYVRRPDGWRTVGDFPFSEATVERVIAQGDSAHVVMSWGTYTFDLYSGEESSFQRGPYVKSDLAIDGSTFVGVSDECTIDRYVDGERVGYGIDGSGVVWADFSETGIGLLGRWSLVLPHATGLTPVAGGPRSMPEGIRLPNQVGGRSPDDFYALYDRSVHEWRGGAWHEAAIWDDHHYSTQLGRDGTGAYVLAARNGLGRWTGDRWDWVLGWGPDEDRWAPFRLHRGDGGDLLAWSGGTLYRERDGAWSEVVVMDDIEMVAQAEDGEILVYGAYRFLGWDTVRALVRIRPGTGRVQAYSDTEMGAVGNVDIDGMDDVGGEILVWSRRPAMVYRLAGFVGSVQWDLVAGPLVGEIERLSRLPGGELVALSTNGVDIHLHRGD